MIHPAQFLTRFDADGEHQIEAASLLALEQPEFVFNASYFAPSTYRYNTTCSGAQRSEQIIGMVERHRKTAGMKCRTGRSRYPLFHALVSLVLPCTP